MKPTAALIGDKSRLHLQHGPIDLIISADAADKKERHRAFDAAAARFDTVLTELVAELPLLRSAVSQKSGTPKGAVARRMDVAVRAHASGEFVTRMAAVAGAVADEILTAMVGAADLSRAYVNNGGDIALFLAPDTSYAAAIAGLDQSALGKIDIPATSNVRGIATSGQGGRSLSLGIADSVTVLAVTAAGADVAATLIANAVDLPGHPNVSRVPADQLQPDSDLGARPVVTHVGALSQNDVALALVRGQMVADRMLCDQQIIAASLTLRREQTFVGRPDIWLSNEIKEVENV